MTLIYLIDGTESAGYRVELNTWENFSSLKLKAKDLLVIPQQAFIAGKIKNFSDLRPSLDAAISLGCDILLTHHHQSELSEYFRLRTVWDEGESYFNNTVDSLKVKGHNKLLAADVPEFPLDHAKVKDEFTYLADGAGWHPIVEKVPASPLNSASGNRYLALAHLRLGHGNRAFLIDIHATGSKRNANGELFKLLLRNVMRFLRKKQSKKLRTPEAQDPLIEAITNSKIGKTEKNALLSIRVGQNRFRSSLLRYWRKCAVSGVAEKSILRAGHIKPWSDSTPAERLDLFNGLLLNPNLDALFNNGLISFDDSGQIIISSKLSKKERLRLHLFPDLHIELRRQHQKYLAYHRNHKLQK